MTDIDAPRGPAPTPASSSARSDRQSPVDLSVVPAAARERWSELVRDIEAARDAYYNAIDAESPLSDADYDVFYRELEDLESAHPALARAGSRPAAWEVAPSPTSLRPPTISACTPCRTSSPSMRSRSGQSA